MAIFAITLRFGQRRVKNSGKQSEIGGFIMKYGDWSLGQTEALINKLGGQEVAEAILRGEKEVSLVDAILKKLFDKNARRIPMNLQKAVCDADKKFCLNRAHVNTVSDYAGRLIRFQQAFKEGPVMSAAEFETKSKKLIGEIANNEALANLLLKGVFLPIILPKLENFSNYGKTLEAVFLPAVKFFYEKEFPGRKFFNYRENDLEGKVGIVAGSRHERLIAKMQKGISVALYFPNPLQGFSVLASREQMLTLPDKLILAGGFDSAVAQAMYPDILDRDFETPGYDLSALSWQSADYSLCFRAGDDGLRFGYGGGLGDVGDRYSSGLLFLGES